MVYIYIYNVCVCVCLWVPGIVYVQLLYINMAGCQGFLVSSGLNSTGTGLRWIATLLQALFHLFRANEPSTSRSCSTTVPSPLPPPVRWEVAYPGEAMLPLVPGTTCMTWWFELSAHRCFLPGCGLRCGDVGWMEVWLNIGARNRM